MKNVFLIFIFIVSTCIICIITTYIHCFCFIHSFPYGQIIKIKYGTFLALMPPISTHCCIKYHKKYDIGSSTILNYTLKLKMICNIFILIKSVLLLLYVCPIYSRYFFLENILLISFFSLFCPKMLREVATQGHRTKNSVKTYSTSSSQS